MHKLQVNYRVFFAFWRQTDRQTNKQTNRWTAPVHEAALAIASGGLINSKD